MIKLLVLLYAINLTLLTAEVKPYKECLPTIKAEDEIRELFVATCDSRSGWKEFMAIRAWNATSYPLSAKDKTINQKPVSMVNACKAQRWDGFLTKPKLYLKWLQTLQIKNEKGKLVL